MNRRNTTFISSEPGWANACVGDNGSPGNWEYSKGFSQAARMIIDLILADGGVEYSVDEMIYPVCFNMRHSVELRLKGAITDLIDIESTRSNHLQFNSSATHDIGIIWRYFSEKSQRSDTRFVSIITRLDEKIRDIADIDATGQTFRYPENSESQRHLVSVSIINFAILKQAFEELEAALDDLYRLNKFLLSEYSVGTHTKSLSRRDIFQIAFQLPPVTTWNDESFRGIKESIKVSFNLGSKELSKGIDIIRSHYELAPLIGESIPLLGLLERDLMEFFGHWFNHHEIARKVDNSDDETQDWDVTDILNTIINDKRKNIELWNSIKSHTTPEIVAGLTALFYFANELDFSESYINRYQSEVVVAKHQYALPDNSFMTQFFHLFNKPNALSHILRSLYFLHKNELADNIVCAYHLEDKYPWLTDTRSRVIFRKPEYCGYSIGPT